MNPTAPETDPTLLALQAAIRAAADRDDAAGMAAACLEHALIVEEQSIQSPLDALEALDLESALLMADDTEPSHRVLWYLLILHHYLKVNTTDKIPSAEDTLSRLIDHPNNLALLQGDEGDNAVWFLVELTLNVGIKAINVAQMVLNQYTLRDFYFSLFLRVGKDEFNTLIQSDQSIVELDLLLKIAESEFYLGFIIDCENTIQESLHIVENTSSAFSKVHGFLRIGELQHKTGNSVAAGRTILQSLEIADEFDDATKASLLPTIAMALSSIGQPRSTGVIVSKAAQSLAQSRSSYSIGYGLCKIMEAQAAAGMLVAATQTLNQVKDKDTKDHALRSIIKREAQSGQIKVAQWAVDHINDTERKIYGLLDIASELAKIGTRTEEAEAYFASARKTAGKIRNSEFRSSALTGVVKAEINAGYVSNAVKTATSIEDLEEKVNSQLMLAQALINRENTEEAMLSISIAARAANLLTNPSTVKELLQEVYAHLAQVQALTGQIDEVRVTISKIDSRWRKNAVCSTVAQVYARRGQAVEADALVDTIGDAIAKVLSQSKLIEIYFQTGRKSEAEAAVTQTLLRSRELEIWPRLINLMGVATWQRNIGQTAVAERFLVAALRSAGHVEASWRLEDAIERIEKIKIDQGSIVDTAKAPTSAGPSVMVSGNTAQSIDPWDITGALLNFACAEAMAGRTANSKDAFAVAVTSSELIQGAEWRTEAISRIAWKQAQCGQIDEAIMLSKRILTKRDLHLPRLIRAIAEQESKIEGENEVKYPHFKQMLVPFAHYLGTAYEICGLLAELYPEAAEKIGKIVADSPL